MERHINNIINSDVSIADLDITKIEWLEVCPLFEEDFYNELMSMSNSKRAE